MRGYYGPQVEAHCIVCLTSFTRKQPRQKYCDVFCYERAKIVAQTLSRKLKPKTQLPADTKKDNRYDHEPTGMTKNILIGHTNR